MCVDEEDEQTAAEADKRRDVGLPSSNRDTRDVSHLHE